MKTHIQKLFLALLLGNATLAAYAQGTAFTYTGRLNDNGVPANGAYELRFTLYEVNVAGNVIAGLPPVSPVDVANGLFTVRLDFGANVFTGPPRWLQIEVRPVGGANFTLLDPRQEVTSSPYAIRAASAGSVASGAVTANQLNTAGVAPVPGQFLSYNGGNLFWSDPGVAAGNIFSLNGTSAYYIGGNVGIGTSTPAHRLSLSGGPSWTANGWLGALELPNIAAIGWRANAAGQRFGMGHTGTGFFMFRTASDPGTTGSPAIYDFTINDTGNVGIGTTTPTGRLQVAGGWDGEQGALQLSGHKPTIRFTGDADSGNESWLVHLGGPAGHLGFFRRTGPAAWSPVMQLTPSIGRQMEIYGQDALALIGYQPFMSFYDANNNTYAKARIQSADGNLFFRPDGGHVTAEATDLWLGHPTRRGSAGRALVDAGVVNGSSELHLNFASDWAKTVIGGNNVSVCTLTIRGGCDLAEPFQMSAQDIPKGAVVVIDNDNAGKLKLSDREYDRRVAGIVSGANGIEPGISLYQQGAIEGGQNVALSGRVYVQADASSCAIEPGDLLTTSGRPGHAMKVADHSRSQGAILGKAMTALKDGQGMVLVLVTLQ